jgi:hypothetical protein
MGLGFWIKSIEFSDGTTVPLAADSITVLVGANNVGKSQSLRDIYELCESSGARGIEVVKRVELDAFGTYEDFLLRYKGTLNNRGYVVRGDFQLRGPFDAQVGAKEAARAFEEPMNHECGPLARFFVSRADVESRLSVSKPAEAFDAIDEAPKDPIHVLFSDESVESEVSEAFSLAFGVGLFVNRLAGKTIPLYCGEKPAESPIDAFLLACRKLPRLDEQGDGMRSFAGCLLHVCATRAFTVLVDEPEAFLHPPQARLLGAMLSKRVRAGRQIIIATHSGDLIRGLLEANPSNVTIVRVSRSGNINLPAVLPAKDVTHVWSDPALRYSNILDGLFHERVVLCEGDADCRFFFTLMNTICEDANQSMPDVMFSASSGKQRFPILADSLRRLEVPVTIVADFDVLRDSTLLGKLVASQGGEWSKVEKCWNVLSAAIGQAAAGRTVGSVGRAIKDLIAKEPPQAPFTRKIAEGLREVTKADGPWDIAKSVGLNVVRGDAAVAGKTLLAALRSLGIFIIDSGELESFDRLISGTGAKWVNEALSRDLRGPELDRARAFVADLLSHLRGPSAVSRERTGRERRLPGAVGSDKLEKRLAFTESELRAAIEAGAKRALANVENASEIARQAESTLSTGTELRPRPLPRMWVLTIVVCAVGGLAIALAIIFAFRALGGHP